MKSKLLICDMETMGVLCITDSEACAIALSEGIFNVKIVPVPDYYWTEIPEWKNLDFDKMYLKFDDSKGLEVSKLESHLIDEKFQKKRSLCILRRKFFLKLEYYLETVLLKNKITFDTSVFPYIDIQLLQCSVDSKKFTDPIVEYAEHNSISTEQAYYELKMLSESHNKLRFRLFSSYKKYVRRFNQLECYEDLDRAFKEVIEDVFINARL